MPLMIAPLLTRPRPDDRSQPGLYPRHGALQMPLADLPLRRCARVILDEIRHRRHIHLDAFLAVSQPAQTVAFGVVFVFAVRGAFAAYFDFLDEEREREIIC